MEEEETQVVYQELNLWEDLVSLELSVELLGNLEMEETLETKDKESPMDKDKETWD